MEAAHPEPAAAASSFCFWKTLDRIPRMAAEVGGEGMRQVGVGHVQHAGGGEISISSSHRALGRVGGAKRSRATEPLPLSAG